MNRTKRLLLLFMLGFLGYSCSDKETMPKDKISGDTMALILADMHVLEASFALGHLDSLNTGIRPENFNERVLNKYRVSKQTFDSSYNYYLLNPDYFNKIYDDVLVSLSKKQAHINK